MKHFLLSILIMAGFLAKGQSPCETPTIISPNPVFVCEGSSGIMLNVGVSSSASPITYKWRKEGSDKILSEMDTIFIAPIQAEDSGNYYVEVDYGCGTWQSEKVRVTIVKPVMPAVSIYCDPIMFEGQVATTMITSSIGAGSDPLYRYFHNGIQEAVSTSESFNFIVGLGANHIMVEMQASPFECVFTAYANAKVVVTGVERPSRAVIMTEHSVISDDNLLLEAIPPTVGTGVWRMVNGTGIFDDSTQASTFVRHLSPDSRTMIVWEVKGEAGANTLSTKDTLNIETIIQLGMDEQEAMGASLGPNPTEGALSIVLNNELPTSIFLLTLTGEEVQHWTCYRSAQLSLSDELPKGTYLLRLQNERGVRVEKLIKK